MSDFTDALVNKLTPDQQIAPLINPIDQVPESEMVFAEQVGLKIIEHTNGSVLTASPDRFTDTTNSPFSLADIGRYIYIRSGANQGMYRVATYVDASNVDVEQPDGSAAGFTDQSNIDYGLHEEPNLEDSINYALTQLREIVDPANDWFQDMPRAFDPSDTSGANAKNEKMNLKTLSDNWYGSKTKIVDVVDEESGLADTDTGVLVLTSLGYADDADRRGFVIQSSVGNAYHDEIALASIIVGKHKVTITDALTGNEFKDASGNLIYGVLQDGADHSGSGEGTDVFVKFVYDNAGTPTAYTWTADDPTDVIMYLPFRKRRSELLEYDERVFKVAGIVGDAELTQDISEIRNALGIADGDGAGDWDLTNTGNFFPFSGLTLATATMEDIVNILNSAIGSRDYTDENIISDGETITQSLDKLDQFLGQGGYKTKVLERVTAAIAKGVAHTIPFATGSAPAITTYKQDSSHFGRYMEVRVSGKKLVPDSGAVETDGEYEETSTTQVTFRFTVRVGQIIEYIVIDDA